MAPPEARSQQPEAAREIAEAVCFPADPIDVYSTSQTFVMDGGWTVQGIPDVPDRLGNLER